MAFVTGETVGGYEVLGLLGRGGMGEVYRVRNVISDRAEAMKVVLPAIAADSDLAARFLAEIKLHSSLDHPHIVAVHTALRAADTIVMVMELVEGTALDERLRGGRIPIPEAVRLMDQALDALAYAHSRGVVHRDIKPANLIVTTGGQVKVTDFGIALGLSDARLTGAGMAVGSAYYMSPEQVMAEAVDARSDIYSAGVTLYEMVTGQRPIRGESDSAVLYGHLCQTPVPPIDINAEVSPALSVTILKAMARRREDRFQSAAEFRDALRGAVSASTGAGIDTQARSRIEALLTSAVGPIAAHLVARSAPRCATLAELCSDLAQHIPAGEKRDAFLRACGTGTATTASRRPLSTASPAAVDLGPLDDIKRKLALHVGPIASVLVDRCARSAQSRAELLDAVAQHIPASADRNKFVRSLNQ